MRSSRDDVNLRWQAFLQFGPALLRKQHPGISDYELTRQLLHVFESCLTDKTRWGFVFGAEHKADLSQVFAGDVSAPNFVAALADAATRKRRPEVLVLGEPSPKRSAVAATKQSSAPALGAAHRGAAGSGSGGSTAAVVKASSTAPGLPPTQQARRLLAFELYQRDFGDKDNVMAYFELSDQQRRALFEEERQREGVTAVQKKGLQLFLERNSNKKIE